MRSLKATLVPLAVAVALAGCAGTATVATTPESEVPTPTARVTEAPATPSARPSKAPPAVACPNEHGGTCLGELTAGTYSTRVFEAPLTYTVPDGWANYEDLPGNFLLVPPASTLDDTDAGIGEYIGVYDGVAVPVGPPACHEWPDEDFARTPQGIVDALSSRDGLVLTGLEPVTVGGLEGMVVDLSLEDGYADSCPFAAGAPTMPIIIGTGPASLHHTLAPSFILRLYVLAGPNDRPLVIEIEDVPDRQSIDELDAVVRAFHFTSGG